MGIVTVTTIADEDETITKTKLNGLAGNLVTEFNGFIDNANIKAAAAIAYSKLASLTDGNLLVGSAGNVATSVAMTGDVTITNAGVTSIVAGSIVNADIDAAAAIDFSKLAALTDGNLLIGNGSNVATSVSTSGDITLSNAGVFAIGSGVIVNADINASAAIDFSKLAALTSTNILVGNGSNVAASVTMTGDITISNAGVTAIGLGVIVDADVNASAAIALSKLATTGTLQSTDLADGTTTLNVTELGAGVIGWIIDGSGSAITTGIKGDLEIPFACTIQRATLLADQTGSIVIDIFKDSFANFPPTVADTITAAAKPTLSAEIKSQDSTLTGWTTAVSAGDILRFNVDSVATITRVEVSLKIVKV